jgi:uncharacterized protein YjbI with pentapeptide repeats
MDGTLLEKYAGGERDHSRTRARGADLDGEKLPGIVLNGADLVNLTLRDGDLSRSDLGGANLSGANLRGTDLRRASLRGTDLTGADLSGTHLGGADLHDAIIVNVRFHNARLEDTVLSAGNVVTMRIRDKRAINRSRLEYLAGESERFWRYVIRLFLVAGLGIAVTLHDRFF